VGKARSLPLSGALVFQNILLFFFDIKCHLNNAFRESGERGLKGHKLKVVWTESKMSNPEGNLVLSNLFIFSTFMNRFKFSCLFINTSFSMA
jgi:hypothetical protein